MFLLTLIDRQPETQFELIVTHIMSNTGITGTSDRSFTSSKDPQKGDVKNIKSVTQQIK